jgi:diazepam-binding inhibitor (GABA receptor modulating acyl-CoA-binding protein)
MNELEIRFQMAAEQVQKLPQRPDNDTLLNLYALYKQATSGDVSGKRPGFTNPAGRLKYDSWARRKGLSKDIAMQEYVDLVDKLLKQ